MCNMRRPRHVGREGRFWRKPEGRSPRPVRRLQTGIALPGSFRKAPAAAGRTAVTSRMRIVIHRAARLHAALLRWRFPRHSCSDRGTTTDHERATATSRETTCFSFFFFPRLWVDEIDGAFLFVCFFNLFCFWALGRLANCWHASELVSCDMTEESRTRRHLNCRCCAKVLHEPSFAHVRSLSSK